MDSAETDLVRKTVSSILTDADPSRSLPMLVEAGIVDVLSLDEAVATSILLGEQGRQLSAAPLLDLIILTAWGIDASGGVAIVHPGPGAHHRPPSRVAEDHVLVDGLSMTSPGAGPYWTALIDGDELRLFPITEDQLTFNTAGGVDPGLGVRRITARLPLSALEASELASSSWEATVALAQRALGHALAATARRLLEIALDHVTVRAQFGRPISEFQSVKHRLAEVAAELAATEELLDLAWLVDDELASVAAKIYSGRTALLAARHAQQVCGGIGFTWEHPLHRFIRRAYAVDGLYGASHVLEVELGQRLLADGSVPRFGHVE